MESFTPNMEYVALLRRKAAMGECRPKDIVKRVEYIQIDQQLLSIEKVMPIKELLQNHKIAFPHAGQ